MTKKAFSILLITIVSLQAQSQQKNEDSTTHNLNEVVVTGQFHPQSLKKSVYQVKVINKERIQLQGATKLQDVLSNELNIRFDQDNAVGSSNITMMGLSGQNVKVLLDGVPITGRQGTTNEVDINLIDVNSIERIEIVEGPMSVMYGADALAGVINIITKRPGRDTYNVQAKVQEETAGKEYGIDQGIHNQNLSLGWRNKSWEIGAGINHNNFDGWQGDTTGRVKTWKPKDQLAGNFQARYTGKNWNLRYRLDAMNEVIKNEGNFIVNTASDQKYKTDRLMHQLQSDIGISSKFVIQAMASYTNFQRKTTNTEIDKTTGLEYYSAVPGDKTTFTGTSMRVMGMYTLSSSINLQAGIDGNIETAEGDRIAAGVKKITDAGLFIAPELKVKNVLQIRPGLRAIYNSVYDAPPVVPSLNIKWMVSKYSDIRVSYARGFRAPSLRELYFYFFDANHQIQGNPNLKAELSHSFNAFYTLQCKQTDNFKWQTVVSGFYNDISNQIGYAQSASNPSLTTYINIDNYKSTGGTFTNNMQWKKITASAGAGYTGRYNSYSKSDKNLPEFKWSPEVNASLSYSFTKIGLNASLFYKYTGKLPYYQQVEENGENVIRLAQINGYNWADFTLSKKLFKYLTLQGGIRNLFNVTNVNNSAVAAGAHSTAGAKPVGYGRSYFLSVAFNLNK